MLSIDVLLTPVGPSYNEETISTSAQFKTPFQPFNFLFFQRKFLGFHAVPSSSF